MPDHPRCPFCADNPPGNPHCWAIDRQDDAEPPLAACRHCPATAEVCAACAGDGVDDDVWDWDAERTEDCLNCQGQGVIWPARKREVPHA